MHLWSASSSACIRTNTRPGQTDTASLVLHSGRRMTVSGQLCLREWGDFTVEHVTVAAPDGVVASWHFVENAVYNDGVPYPDILSNRPSVEVKAHTTQSIWIDLRITAEVPVGTYPVTVTAHTSLGEFTANWTLVVHKATLPLPAESEFGHEYFFNLNLDPYFDAPRYSESWWALMKTVAQTMQELRVNSLHIPLVSLLADGGSKRVSADEWVFDFTRVDEFISCFLRWGSFAQLSQSALLTSVTGEQLSIINESGSTESVASMSEESERWLSAYAPAVYAHFKEKGWLSMLCLRLEDEPHTKEYWLWLRERMRTYMPGVPCGEPIDTHEVGRELGGACDQYIPRLEVYERGVDFYKTRQAAGDTVWVYSCCYPEDPWYLNKFIDLPHAYSRMMAWACYAQGITGFLHWGFNYWNIPLYGLSPEARFKGDGFIVYPDTERQTLALSVRGAETRDGLQDWELLRLLAAQDSAAALSLARRVAVSFSQFTYDPTGRLLDTTGAELLTLLDR